MQNREQIHRWVVHRDHSSRANEDYLGQENGFALYCREANLFMQSA